MLFNSFEFLIFFPIVTLTYFALPHRFRWVLLLLASCVFYMAFVPAYILILFFTITVDYFAGILIAGSVGRRRKLFLIASILANIGVLGFFKYFNFLNANLTDLGHALGWNYSIAALGILLPIGLSFHTFQSLSYTIEVYRGNFVPERHPGILAVYVLFYPQLVAGPIERPQNLLHQFREKHYFDYVRVTEGLRLMAWGFFKKVAIADNLALVVDRVYNSPTEFPGPALIIATVCFAFQIYADFSGYTDIARGAAQVMGFKLMVNFNRPYAAMSVAEFWQRWHISLSTWFRDYLYIPLGGNRVPRWRWQLNLLITFLVSGLWHGANWTFLIWGALHGFYLLSSLWTEGLRAKIRTLTGLDKLPVLRQVLATATTFILICVAWIFFRANNIGDAFYILTNLFSNPSGKAIEFSELGLTDLKWVMLLGSLAVLEIGQLIGARPDGSRRFLGALPVRVRWAGYYAIIAWLLLFGQFGSQQFIYFQF